MPVEAGFAVVIVLDGSGVLAGASGSVEAQRGQVFAVPAGFGDWTAAGVARLAVCRPAAGWPADVRSTTR